MANMEMLRQCVDESGITKTALSQKMGLTRAGLLKKLSGATEFKASEILSISTILHLSDKERDTIFFSPDVESNSAK